MQTKERSSCLKPSKICVTKGLRCQSMIYKSEFENSLRRIEAPWPQSRNYDRVDRDGIYTGSRKVHNPKPGGYKYDVYHPKTKKVCVPPVNGYRFPEVKMKEFLASDRVLFGEDESQIIQLKQYLHEYEGKLSSVIHLDSRTEQMNSMTLFGVQKVFSNPKPELAVDWHIWFCCLRRTTLS